MRSISSGSIDGAGFAVAAFQSFSYKLETDVLVDQSQQIVFRNLIFQTEVVEQSLRTRVLPHHNQHTSVRENTTQHEQILLLLTCFCEIWACLPRDFFNTHA
jgi:hypothetical protein